MRWLRRAAILGCAVAVLATALTFGNPDPPEAKANVVCEIGISPGSAVTGALGIGNPVGDACDAITDPVLGVAGHVLDPLKEAAASIGKGVFNQITTWATDGAVWLLGEVVELTEKTTSPDLLSKGFLRQYRGMASIATVLAVLMLLFAVLESLGRGDGGMLWRVFLVNVPLAAIATSAAYVVVQLLIATTDGFSEAITHSTAADTHAFFKGAVEALAEAGGSAGTAVGTVTGGPGQGAATGAAASAEVPLFVGFIAAIVAATAAFLVWIELLMRSAAIYVVALFLPMAIAASIWPRWVSALKRTAELLIVVVFSKFCIVAIIALAASLLAHTEGKIEQVLSAGALLLLACFSPFVLLKLVPFAEGAMSSAYNRSSAGGASVQAIHTASSIQMMRHSARANWAGAGDGNGAAGGSGGKSGGGGGTASKGRPGGSGGGGGSSAGEAAGASGGAAGVAALPVAAGVASAKAGKAGGERLAKTGTAQEAGGVAEGSAGSGAAANGASDTAGAADGRPARPQAEQGAAGGAQGSSSSSSSPTPEPTEAPGGRAPDADAKPPRPSGGGAGKAREGGGSKGAASEAKP
jgi:type IV secretion system protein TrbL